MKISDYPLYQKMHEVCVEVQFLPKSPQARRVSELVDELENMVAQTLVKINESPAAQSPITGTDHPPLRNGRKGGREGGGVS